MAYDFLTVKTKADNNDVRSQVILARMLWIGVPSQRVNIDRKRALEYLRRAASRYYDAEAIDLIRRIK